MREGSKCTEIHPACPDRPTDRWVGWGGTTKKVLNNLHRMLTDLHRSSGGGGGGATKKPAHANRPTGRCSVGGVINLGPYACQHG